MGSIRGALGGPGSGFIIPVLFSKWLYLFSLEKPVCQGHNVIAVTLFTSKALTAGRILGAMALFTSFGGAALLSIPSQSANTGQLLASAVTLSTDGAQISGVQFDLAWDQGLDVQIATGSEMRNAVKLIYSAPLATRSMRVLIVGMNQNRIADGELVRLFIVVNLAAGSAQIKLNNPVGVTAGGDLVSIPASSATIHMDATASGAPLLSDGVLNAASLRPGPIAPGEIVTLVGAFGIDANSPPGVVASVNGSPAAVLYALGNQINAVVPFGLDSGNSGGTRTPRPEPATGPDYPPNCRGLAGSVHSKRRRSWAWSHFEPGLQRELTF